MTDPSNYKVTPITQIDQQMVELLSDILGVEESRVIEIALHEWLEANFMRVNSLHRNTVSIYNQLYPNASS
ncbi:MAG: hypothetical protein Tp158DCM1229571_102 [Prokaryotic dsDNA virus sp.]|nr:MAG: hypothetical protein Tp158DCM1229571_102 [Prokaryotic dsDNA virus sp.]|tara:strand:+ start:8075 stop:8287 length:213 start_codon:yes stop_codon:yes gene_type:complete